MPLRWWFLTGVGALLAISALFGGLADAESVAAGPPHVEAGTENVGPQFTSIVRSAETSPVVPGIVSEPEEGNTYLLVSATVTNTWRISTNANDLLQLPWLGDGLAVAERVVLVSDGTTNPQAHPGVPIDVVYVWEVPLADVPESTMPVTVIEKVLTEDGDLTYGAYWSDPTPAAIVTLAVER